jgi:hypothetical protein
MCPIEPSSAADELKISAPDCQSDASELIDLLSKTYSFGLGYWNGERASRNGYLLKSNYDWKASRIGKLGSAIVTHFGIWRLQVRVGRARVWVAGIGRSRRTITIGKEDFCVRRPPSLWNFFAVLITTSPYCLVFRASMKNMVIAGPGRA